MTPDANGRASMLQRVADAIGHADRRAREPAGASAAVPAIEGDIRELGSAFARGCEEAQGTVHLAEGIEPAREVVASVLLSARTRRVVVSPDAAGVPWDLAVHLRAAGLETSTGAERLRERAGNAANWRKRRRHDAFSADAGVCVASYGLADTGTLVLCSSAENHRLDSLAPRVSVVVLPTSRLVAGLGPLFERLTTERRFELSSAVTFVRGPSRTADIELSLTIGVHGPQHLHVVLVNQSGPAQVAAS